MITVKLFAIAKQLTHKEEIQLEFSTPATLADLKQRLEQIEPELAPLLQHAALAVDGQYQTESFQLPPACEVALIPPVSGG